jgi:CDP-2,3-bis-(O-geranylgeranyl)-sn-glycerol synthase
MDLPLLLRLLVLLALANGLPLAARGLFGVRWAYPIDGNRRFVDGRPLFGQSKTIRGALLAIAATTAAAPLLRFDWRIGALVGGLAMLGDLFSSFLKRRLALPPSSPALGLDQIPEALFPMLACRVPLALPVTGIAAVVAVFFAGEVLLSRLLWALRLRERPY